MSVVNPTIKVLNHKATLFLFAFIVIVFNFTFIVDGIDASSENPDSITITHLLDAHNKERGLKGLKPLKLDNKLSLSAQTKAKAMLDSNCWSHYCPEGISPWEYFEDANYSYQIAGENLAEGFYGIDEVMRAWLNSDSHKENILKPQFEDIGFGLVYGNFQGKQNNVIVAVHFGTTDKKALGAILNKDVFIDFPKNNQIFNTNNFVIKGKTSSAQSILIYSNDQFIDTTSVNEGVFTYNMQDIDDGEFKLYVEGVFADGSRARSNEVSITVKNTLGNITTFSSGTIPVLSTIDPQTKNLINLAFAFIFALIFLIDFILLEYTDMFGRRKSLSHFNFSIFIIVAMIIIVGGFGGHLTETSALI